MKKDMSWLTELPVAHRGLHDNKIAPENSILAFKNAIEAGYPIEFDVHLTKDGTLVVHHDDKLTRTAGQKISILDIDSSHLEKYPLFNTKECIPTFDEVLNTIDGKVNLVIEIKHTFHPKEVCEAVMKRLASYKGKYCIESFDYFVVNYMHKHYPDEILGQLYDYYPHQRLGAFLLGQHKKVDFFAICIFNAKSYCYKFARKQNPKALTISWTIRTPKDLDTAKKYCDNYIFETNLKNGTYIAPPKVTK